MVGAGRASAGRAPPAGPLASGTPSGGCRLPSRPQVPPPRPGPEASLSPVEAFALLTPSRARVTVSRSPPHPTLAPRQVSQAAGDPEAPPSTRLVTPVTPTTFRCKHPDKVLPDSLTCLHGHLLRALDMWRNTPELE